MKILSPPFFFSASCLEMKRNEMKEQREREWIFNFLLMMIYVKQLERLENVLQKKKKR